MLLAQQMTYGGHACPPFPPSALLAQKHTRRLPASFSLTPLHSPRHYIPPFPVRSPFVVFVVFAVVKIAFSLDSRPIYPDNTPSLHNVSLDHFILKGCAMLGLKDFWVALAYLLCIGSALLCLVYGLVNWNKGDEPVKVEDVTWAKEEKAEEESM
jgi:hypothetical protein